MNIGELISVKTLEEQENLFGGKEKHTPYSTEVRLFSCVQQGDIEQLLEQLKSIDSMIVMGKMSDDDIMQHKYMAVSTVTLATRYAIQGGLNEKKAYEFSDRVIRLVDKLNSKNEILVCLGAEIIKLTEEVRKSKAQPEFSPHVRKCIRYINENPSSKITVSMLSDYCGISADYLSQIFKNEIGENLSSYVIRQKLEIAKNMLAKKMKNSEICKELGFSSQSHFITAFRRHYHMTPSEYVKLIKK